MPVPHHGSDSSSPQSRIDELLRELQEAGVLLDQAPAGSMVRGWYLYAEVVDPDGGEWYDYFAPERQPVSMTVGMADLGCRRVRGEAMYGPLSGDG